MTAHHRRAALTVNFPLVNLQEMLGLEDLTAFVALIRSLLLELDNMIRGLDFMTSKTVKHVTGRTWFSPVKTLTCEFSPRSCSVMK